MTFAFSSLETGQPCLALPASSASFAWSAPGTLARKVRWTAVMAKLSACFSSVTSKGVDDRQPHYPESGKLLMLAAPPRTVI